LNSISEQYNTNKVIVKNKKTSSRAYYKNK